jgi:hypothetical protein
MNTLQKLLTCALAMTFATCVVAQNAAPTADAAGTVAALSGVQGNVLVSDATGMASGVDKQRIKNNVRVTTTSRAAVIITFDNGCVVALKENERIDIDGSKTCPALLAAVQVVPIAAPLGAVAAVPGLGVPPAALILTGVGVGGYLLYRNNRNVSPN